ncbi:hypothetical protein LCGC14_2859740 [marine sediment metagenome]|uniref:Uncharacterized protein n=1 Tax=marine sediment metagenome TaxID=412755 RepID=A0A0F9AX09_9ZZZZ
MDDGGRKTDDGRQKTGKRRQKGKDEFPYGNGCIPSGWMIRFQNGMDFFVIWDESLREWGRTILMQGHFPGHAAETD